MESREKTDTLNPYLKFIKPLFLNVKALPTNKREVKGMEITIAMTTNDLIVTMTVLILSGAGIIYSMLKK